MKIKYYVALLLLLFFSMLLFGCDPSAIGSDDYGTSDVSGYVMDEISFNGIYNAAVILPNIDTLRTDKNGFFSISTYFLSQNPQEIIIEAIKDGYKHNNISVKLVSDGKVNVTIPMQRSN